MKLKYTRLNSHGAGHLVLIMLVIVGSGLIGSFLLYKSHADPIRETSSCKPFGQGKYRHCGTAVELSSAAVASWILADKNIGYYSSAPKKDLQTMAAKKYILKETCGKPVILHPQMLSAVYNTSTFYKIKIDNFVTGRHGCDKLMHPKGKAVDIGYAKDVKTGKHTNFLDGDGGNNSGVSRAFIQRFSSNLPSGSSVGQVECYKRKTTLPHGIQWFRGDSCNHQHFELGR